MSNKIIPSAPKEVVDLFRRRLEEIKSNPEVKYPWVTAYYTRERLGPIIGGLWLPEMAWHEAIGDQSYVHCSLVMAAEFALGDMGIEPESTPEYTRLDVSVSPPQLPLARLVGTMQPVRQQVERDFEVEIEPLI